MIFFKCVFFPHFFALFSFCSLLSLQILLIHLRIGVPGCTLENDHVVYIPFSSLNIILSLGIVSLIIQSLYGMDISIARISKY